MIFLFDTDVLIELLGRRPRAGLIERFDRTASAERATSTITLGELLIGAYRLGSIDTVELARIDELISGLRLLTFDEAAARRYADVYAGLENRGLRIGHRDSQIAAIALVHGLTVVTGNVAHFGRVPGLAVEN